METEREKAFRLANEILDRPHDDPDDDLAVLARNLLRTKEKLDAVWHFAACPFDHCEECIADEELIKHLHTFCGNPTDYKSPFPNRTSQN